MKRFEIVDEIGKGCGLSVIASTLAIAAATAIQFTSAPKEVQEACQRVNFMGMAIAVIGGVGAVLSDRAISKMAQEAIERIEKARWESLKKVIKGRGYSVASCRDCKHLVGHLGDDHVLICAMHPYGWKGWDCPDKEDKEVCYR